MTGTLQQARRQRGEDFQDEMRRSWARMPSSWRMRIPDGGGGTRPADEIVLLPFANILAEHKRTDGDRFELQFLRPNQVKGLIDFDKVLDQNLGMVFVSFLNEEAGTDEVYGFRLITALNYLKDKFVTYIPIRIFQNSLIPCLRMNLLEEGGERAYDVRGLETCYKYL